MIQEETPEELLQKSILGFYEEYKKAVEADNKSGLYNDLKEFFLDLDKYQRVRGDSLDNLKKLKSNYFFSVECFAMAPETAAENLLKMYKKYEKNIFGRLWDSFCSIINALFGKNKLNKITDALATTAYRVNEVLTQVEKGRIPLEERAYEVEAKVEDSFELLDAELNKQGILPIAGVLKKFINEATNCNVEIIELFCKDLLKDIKAKNEDGQYFVKNCSLRSSAEDMARYILNLISCYLWNEEGRFTQAEQNTFSEKLEELKISIQGLQEELK